MNKKVSFFVLHLSLIIASAMIISSCVSKRKAVKEEAGGATTTAVTTKPTTERQQIVALVNRNSQTAKGLRSRMNIKLAAGGKSASAGGTIKMKRDEIIQLSLTALGLFEIGRMELTPDYLFVQDRVNKQYVQVKWSEIEALRNSGADFYTFQALFWNELFMLGSKARPTDDDFAATSSANKATLTPKNQHVAVSQQALQFVVNSAQYLLEQAMLTTSKGGNLSVTCDYTDFNNLEGKKFPSQMKLAIASGTKRYTADIAMSSPQVDENMRDLTTKPSSGYKRVSFDDIIKQLVK